MRPLPTSIACRITHLCEQGDEHLQRRRFDAAVLQYKGAFDLLPSPKQQWQETIVILNGIVDACLQKGDFAGAEDALEAALECPFADRDAGVQLRFGKLLFETGRRDEARQMLLQAFCQGGRKVFAPHDPKYWEWLCEPN